MKKVVLILLLLCPILTLSLNAGTNAREYFIYEGLYYDIQSDSTVELTYTKDGTSYDVTDLIIPEFVTYNGKKYTVTSIGRYAFEKCRTIKHISFPSSIRIIWDDAFSFCTSLDTLLLPEGLEQINYSFHHCDSLKYVRFPNSLKYILQGAFSDNLSLDSIYIPQNVRYVGPAVFAACPNLRSIVVDNNNPYFESRDNCNAICCNDTLVAGCSTSHIPKNIHVIGDGAFNEIQVDFVLTDSIRSIGDHAFFMNSVITELTIPASVESIGDLAFRECVNIKKITLLGEDISIGLDVFQGLNSLTDVYNYALTPQSIPDYTFARPKWGPMRLHVPEASIDAYKSATGWKTFSQIVPIDDTNAINTFKMNLHKEAIYSIQGIRKQSLSRGINILQSKGKTRKVLVK